MLFIVSLSMIVVGLLAAVIAHGSNPDPNARLNSICYSIGILSVPAFLFIFLGLVLFYGLPFGNSED